MDLGQLPAGLCAARGSAPDSRSGVESLYATGYWLLARDRVTDAAKVFRVMLHAAPRDERGWLGLGECHERAGQYRIALQLYGAGSVVAESGVRCHVARARVLRALDLPDEAREALDLAERAADDSRDADLADLVVRARRSSP
jgi:tetratricopeptide (TPR) repeat protein